MPGLKVTVGAAMRARDVSRPRADQDAAAEAAIADLPTLRSALGSRAIPLTREPGAPAPFPPRRPVPVAPVPAAPVPAAPVSTAPVSTAPVPAAPDGTSRPAPAPQQAAAPVPAPRPAPSSLDGSNAPPAVAGEPGTGRAAEPAASGAGSSASPPASPRPAKRKRVRRRRSHGR